MPQAQATPRTEVKSDATAVPQVVQNVHDRFGDPKNFINRELSWLAFNRRVLEEAQDPAQPLIERVKFLTIVSSNLDEFFEIRVAGVKQLLELGSGQFATDTLSLQEQLAAIHQRANSLCAEQYRCLNEVLLPAMRKEGISLQSRSEWSPAAGLP